MALNFRYHSNNKEGFCGTALNVAVCSIRTVGVHDPFLWASTFNGLLCRFGRKKTSTRAGRNCAGYYSLNQYSKHVQGRLVMHRLQGDSFALKFVSPRYIDKQKSSVEKAVGTQFGSSYVYLMACSLGGVRSAVNGLVKRHF